MTKDLYNRIKGDPNIRVVSVDLCNTLLFRRVREPQELFKKMYLKSPEAFKNIKDAEHWKKLRTEAEQRARKRKLEFRKIKEVTLREIYSELPYGQGDPEALLALEIQCGEETAFLNPEAVDLLRQLRQIPDVRVILTAETPLSAADLNRILLRCGFDPQLADGLYVSSELGRVKGDGSLYGAILADCGIQPHQALHIGSERNGDFLAAKKTGMQSWHYPAISEAELRYPFLMLEKNRYGPIGNDYYVHRILAADSYQGEPADKPWHDIGAMILGPLLTFAVEWVLDIAEREKISRIFAIMQEGDFLRQLLDRAGESRGWKGEIKLLFLSRKALFPALSLIMTERDLEYLLTTHKMTVGKALGLMEMDPDDVLAAYLEEETEALKASSDPRQREIYQRLADHLMDGSARVKSGNQIEETLLYRYFQQLGMADEPFVSLDIGWKGTVQSAMHRIFEAAGRPDLGRHLLVAGKKERISENNLFSGGGIDAFAMGAAEVEEIYIPLCEAFLMCPAGTTTGYEEKDDKIIPKTKTNTYPRGQLENLLLVQKGILAFQAHYLEQKARNRTARIGAYPIEALNLVGRLSILPTAWEAKYLGELYFDQNFGIDQSWQLIDPVLMEHYRRLGGFWGFRAKGLQRPDEWYQGMDMLAFPYYHIGRSFVQPSGHEALQTVLKALQKVLCADGSFVLVGAGLRCREYLILLSLLGELGRIECILDNDPRLHGMRMMGLTIKPFSASYQSKNCIITTWDHQKVQEIKPALLSEGKELHLFHVEAAPAVFRDGEILRG